MAGDASLSITSHQTRSVRSETTFGPSRPLTCRCYVGQLTKLLTNWVKVAANSCIHRYLGEVTDLHERKREPGALCRLAWKTRKGAEPLVGSPRAVVLGLWKHGRVYGNM